MTALCLYLFGAPRLERDGVPVTTDTRKAIALIAYLAVTQRAHTRDTLATLLWGDADEQHARGALRRTLSVLRSAVGEGAVDASGDTISASPGLWCDVVEFRSGAKGGVDQLAAAVAALAGALSCPGLASEIALISRSGSSWRARRSIASSRRRFRDSPVS